MAITDPATAAEVMNRRRDTDFAFMGIIQIQVLSTYIEDHPSAGPEEGSRPSLPLPLAKIAKNAKEAPITPVFSSQFSEFSGEG